MTTKQDPRELVRDALELSRYDENGNEDAGSYSYWKEAEAAYNGILAELDRREAIIEDWMRLYVETANILNLAIEHHVESMHPEVEEK